MTESDERQERISFAQGMREKEKIEWFRNHLSTWAEENLRDYPWRRTSNPYFILVAEFLLQKTDADTVASIYETFLTQYPTLNKLAYAPVGDIAELLKLPGIGKYTARAILSQAFNKPAAVLDTNVARIIERFFGIEGGRVKSRCKILWNAADTIAPDKEVGRWNLTLLDFGARVCTARNPNCDVCPLCKRCCWVG